ncbi:AAA family ATPase [Moheibacter lacus]|uniref:AAA family ATPase n=1 Tax=Moheibacter lacus TaxID=2745851 RepID=A0A838ZRX1_9FLAO|nr:AAA family ATPase [Moheibacter lacus]MBA5629662.1 AAA family ATPase [Moheibacter lacus]
MFSSIHLNSDLTKQYKSEDSDILNNLSRINIFIGPNNSGKSRFLRDLFIFKDLEFKSNDDKLNKLNNSLLKFNNLIDEYGVERINNLDLSKINFTYDFLSNQTIEKLKDLSKNLNIPNLHKGGIYSKQNSRLYITHQHENYFRNSFKSICDEIIENIYTIIQSKNNYLNIYIPILRGLRGVNYLENKLTNTDSYKIRTIKDYFEVNENLIRNEKAEKHIYTGLSFYEDVKNLLLNSRENRSIIKDFEEFLSKTFFNNKEVTIIPHIEDNAVHINIDKDEYPIYKLGEGIQSIIILTYPLFLNKGKHLKIFIEEPDIYLHPGYQRILIETLLHTEGFENFQYFFSTHSNHFLDMTLDYKNISVYRFEKLKEKKFKIDNIDNPDLTLLEHLGVKNSSVFLTNCTIWIEGITERIYFRKYLELYQESLPENQKRFFEDVHYSFVEYSGNNITHWSFLDNEENPIDIERLCGKAFVITDNDDAKKDSKKFLRIQTLKKNLGENYYCLNGREIENLLTKEIILNTVKELDSQTDKEQVLYKKNSTFSDKTQIGRFVQNRIDGIKNKYEAKSGTLRNKVKFAQTAINQMNKFDDLTKEAKELTKKLYKFISKYN